jgi:hypothetical protein
LKVSASFCEQKEAKKLFLNWGMGVFTTTAQVNQSFLVLFFKKEPLRLL